MGKKVTDTIIITAEPVTHNYPLISQLSGDITKTDDIAICDPIVPYPVVFSPSGDF